ncbi:toxin-antitoxin system, toxin component [Tetragenococcus koreensis]|uniref:Toxin-antitoxin system, toxin component n=1 Tax=Enterococcus dongliensis TaxID=2559925 RepID=A0AAP5KRE4_9ENTE|nr:MULTISPECIES: toxin-antitoxin system, toxin component [Enterococcaceae]MDN6640111.1 toxin-antitoxin system, toxin component [Tetragenococcus sp.]MDN6835695.1 toxin-antitoxin system, toxin component [Lactococcus lactis]MDN6839616.1 toxin-antitoxin system, toxin component [Tetragenococcus halophilus]MCF1586134.1 toxin-antitoxin system, toxin component [Tetragenococcus koreensis]MCF1615720.1 toxin-antitoxin system, toxin component [Tetragenococcus koreensis]
MLRTQIDVIALMKSVSLHVADSFDSASVVAEFETPKELLDYSEQNFDSISDEFLKSFRQDFQNAYVTELIKQLEEQSVTFD